MGRLIYFYKYCIFSLNEATLSSAHKYQNLNSMSLLSYKANIMGYLVHKVFVDRATREVCKLLVIYRLYRKVLVKNIALALQN